MKHLGIQEIVELNEAVLEAGEPFGFYRDRLESIIGSIQGGAIGELFHPTVNEAGAAYLYYLTRGHAFVQGNKRTAVLSCDVFLDLNGAPLLSEIDENFVVKIAVGEADKDRVIDYVAELNGSRVPPGIN